MDCLLYGYDKILKIRAPLKQIISYQKQDNKSGILIDDIKDNNYGNNLSKYIKLYNNSTYYWFITSINGKDITNMEYINIKKILKNIEKRCHKNMNKDGYSLRFVCKNV